MSDFLLQNNIIKMLPITGTSFITLMKTAFSKTGIGCDWSSLNFSEHWRQR
jgi:hypothetical protein